MDIETLYEIKPYGYIYEIRNLVNGKTYIGKHRFKSSERWRDYMGSGNLIKKAVKKYGKEAFEKNLLSVCANNEAMADVEEFLIQDAWRQKKAEYNMAIYTPRFPDWEDTSSELKMAILRPLIENNRETNHGAKANQIKAEKKQKAKMEILENKKDEVISLYKTHGHLKKVGKMLSVSPEILRDFLVENNVELNSQIRKGVKRGPRSLETKAKISKSLQSSPKILALRSREKRVCANKSCQKEFEVIPSSKKKFCGAGCSTFKKTQYLNSVLTYDFLYERYVEKKMSCQEIADSLEVSVTWKAIHGRIKGAGIEIETRRSKKSFVSPKPPEEEVCQVCGSYFFKSRKDATTCSPSCRGTLGRARYLGISVEEMLEKRKVYR